MYFLFGHYCGVASFAGGVISVFGASGSCVVFADSITHPFLKAVSDCSKSLSMYRLHSCATRCGSSFFIFLCMFLRAVSRSFFFESEAFSMEQVMYWIKGSHTFAAWFLFFIGVSGVITTVSRFFWPQETNNNEAMSIHTGKNFFIKKVIK
jgi:hypothetical protein